MKKVVKKFGNSFIIILNKEDRKYYGLEVGDIVDIELIKEVKNEAAEN